MLLVLILKKKTVHKERNETDVWLGIKGEYNGSGSSIKL